MKVKVGDRIFDAEKEPIAIFLEPMDRINIIGMPPQNNVYAAFPKQGYNEEAINAFMSTDWNSPHPDEPVPGKPRLVRDDPEND